ncbi:hypothetical protein CDL15_Pgr011209 [Punica granatum]|uniref:Transmembrane protein n=1 Tax=Punica granatum TaxID=22663 RepID=A0A218WGC3_PUNGR|nr:hypothetical protein CDL15_Pgr011209 [Punica granatum]PKI72816.1 hypothetical protein CRG98_006796 [Punica granatum]
MSSSQSTSTFRWPELFEFSLPWWIFRRLGIASFLSSSFSNISAWWNAPASGDGRGGGGGGGSSGRLFDFVVDDVLWILVTVLESLALVALLCFFFVFCGCTV